jgi:hypothetical protein
MRQYLEPNWQLGLALQRFQQTIDPDHRICSPHLSFTGTRRGMTTVGRLRASPDIPWSHSLFVQPVTVVSRLADYWRASGILWLWRTLRSARWRPKRRAHQREHGRSRGRLRRRACPMATIFNLATKGSRLHRTEMIGRRLCRADKHQYSCPARPMTATTQISRPAAAWVCCPEERRGTHQVGPRPTPGWKCSMVFVL